MAPDYLNALLPAPFCAHALSSQQLVAHMISVERAYLQAMGADASPYDNFTPDMADLTTATARDGVIVPQLVKQMRAHFDQPLLHKGMTSQDVMDTAYAMAFAQINAEFTRLITKAMDTLDQLVGQFGKNTIMARTRMQAALTIPAAHRLAVWKNGLAETQTALAHIRPSLERLSLGGPVGDGRHWDDLEQLSRKMAVLGLTPQPYCQHTLRGHIQDYGNWLTKLTGHNAKIGQDITLMAQQGIDEIKLAGGGASSAMAHKSNPVQAEVLISLGRFNAGLLSALGQAIIHEQERSGAAWTLEWLCLPLMLKTTEASLRNVVDVLGKIETIGR